MDSQALAIMTSSTTRKRKGSLIAATAMSIDIATEPGNSGKRRQRRTASADVLKRPASATGSDVGAVQKTFIFHPVVDDNSPIDCQITGRCLKVGSDFAGISMESLAMKSLNITHSREFHCEKIEYCRKILDKNHTPAVMQEDVMTRDPKRTPKVDVFFCTFPCQPFSRAGRQAGVNDAAGRGVCVIGSLEYIKEHKPKVVIMENVDAILNKKYIGLLELIRAHLEEHGYTFWESVAKLTDFKIPHNRSRWHLVAIRRTSQQREFQWPLPLKGSPTLLDLTLDQIIRPLPAAQWEAMPAGGSATCLTALDKAYKKAVADGINPFSNHIIVDVGASKGFSNAMVGVCPTLTRSRCSQFGYWSTIKGGRLDTNEMALLMGFRRSEVFTDGCCSEHQFAGCIGNGCSVTYLSMLIPEALYAAKLITHMQLNVLRQRAEINRLSLGITLG